MRIDKPQAIIFVAAPAMWTLGLLTNPGQLPNLILFTKLLLGSFFSRTAECVINDYIDQDIDKKIERTKTRPLANQTVTKSEAIGIIISLLFASLGVLLTLPLACLPYGILGAIGMVIYPYSKRYITLPSLVLSSVNALAIPIVYKAMDCDFDFKLMFPLFIAYTAYTKVYEGVYSFQDLKGDLKLNLNSFATKFGHKNAKNIIKILMATSIGSLGICGLLTNQTWLFYLHLIFGSFVFAKHYFKLNTMNEKIIATIFKEAIHFANIIFLGIILGNYIKKQIDTQD